MQILQLKSWEKTGIGATALQLTTESIQCNLVWVGPPLAAGLVASNTDALLVGGASDQRIPVMPSNFGGAWVPCSNANQVWAKAFSTGTNQKLSVVAFVVR